MIKLRKYVKLIPWPLKHMFRCKSDLSKWNGFKVTTFQNIHYFERRPFWKVGKKHVSHARIPWGFFLVDTGTIRDSKPFESVCLQFCLGSPYIWAILTRLMDEVITLCAVTRLINYSCRSFHDHVIINTLHQLFQSMACVPIWPQFQDHCYEFQSHM